jgi:thioredoxin-dependent peroxiredoxin
MECKSLRDSDSAIQAFNVQYFMASTDSLADNTAFAKKNNASFPILSDSNQTVSEAYGVLGRSGFARRWTYYIDPKGIIIHIDKSVSPRTAGTDLVEHLERLMVETH